MMENLCRNRPTPNSCQFLLLENGRQELGGVTAAKGVKNILEGF